MLGAAGSAIALHVLYGLPWFGSPFADILLAFGVLLVLGGVGLNLAAIRALARGRTTVMPHRASERLVTNGPYAVSRNPIYLGNTLL
ncbi:MAG: isoprenylcysteine carboxylmethyltransferase family protein, partial [Mesorhizobium amorphae]